MTRHRAPRSIAQAIAACRKAGRKIGICGQAPSDYPEFAQFLVEHGIDSISLNPDTVVETWLALAANDSPGVETPAPAYEHQS